jgi:beta-fructofuranosidase
VADFFYKPKEAWVGDVIPYYADGEFKLFYLHNWRGKKEGRKNGWYLLGTNDFIRYTEYGSCGIQGGTGHVLEVDGLYHKFYCKFPKNAPQIVCHATSEDFMNWKEIREDSFAADDRIYELSDWRDPFVFWNEEKQEYWMLLAALEKGMHNRKGCTALCTSKDLKNWAYKEPLYSPHIHVSAHECPDLFKIGEWWYLVYSAYTERFATFYRMSKSLHGPWVAPKEDTFDGRAYYAAKTVSDGTRRYAFG